jgi:nicotinamidase/pyrazinamidase
MSNEKKVVLLTIDGQFDFCDPSGKLYVPGADKDMSRLAKMVRRTRGDLDDIIATMDCHRTLHIAHPIWWEDCNGNHPITIPDGPPTLISVADVVGANPKWRATNPAYRQRSIDYVKALEANGRYVLCIWPPHCLIGSKGYTIYPELFDAFCDWEAQFAAVNYVTKGSNIYTEHYSALLADVLDPEDLSTGLNTDLLGVLEDPTVALIAISGEAGSHCVPNTIRDIANNFGEENIKKFRLLVDTISPVAGFEKLQEDFINEMVGRGMEITTSDKFLK